MFVVTGAHFSDALVAGPAAAASNGPVLLTRTTSVTSAVLREIQRLTPDVIVLVGSESAVAPSVEAALAAYAPVTRISGSDRYSTSGLVSSHTFGTDLAVAYVATGLDYPDALTGGVAAAFEGSPLLLVEINAVPSAVGTELTRLQPFDIRILGGTGVVSDTVATVLGGYLAP